MVGLRGAPKGVRLVRLVRGLRQYDLEVLTGISAAVIGRIERGEREASPDEAERIAHALRIPEGSTVLRHDP